MLSFDLDTQQRSVLTDSDRMPCMPDNIHRDKHSTAYYWVGCGSPIRAQGTFDLYAAMGALPVIRQLMVYTMPHNVIAALARAQAMVVRMRIVNDSWHEVSDVLMDPNGAVLHTTTSAVWRQEDDRLWFTSFKPVGGRAKRTYRNSCAPLVDISLTL